MRARARIRPRGGGAGPRRRRRHRGRRSVGLRARAAAPQPARRGGCPGAGVRSAPASPPPLLNIANVLTGVRLLLVPVFLVVLFTEDGTDTSWRLAATGVFAL